MINFKKVPAVLGNCFHILIVAIKKMENKSFALGSFKSKSSMLASGKIPS